MGLFMRILIAVIACAFLFVLIPLIADVLGLVLNSSLASIIKLCIAAIAVFYIIWGPTPSNPLA